LALQHHGSHPYQGFARPQSVEPPHGHPGHRVVRCRRNAAIGRIAGFESRLRARFPEISPFQPTGTRRLHSHGPCAGTGRAGPAGPGGLPGHLQLHHAHGRRRVYQVVVEYSEEAVGRLAMDLAQALCRSRWTTRRLTWHSALAQLRDLDEDVRLGPSTGCIVDAAVARNIPFSRMTEGSMVRFGWGSKQRRIQAAEMDVTSAISEAIAQDKELTKKLLAAAGVPVPRDAR
jgi:cyanophycin synthetase